MWWIAAATDVPGSDSQPIIVALISALAGVLAAVIGGLVNMARKEGSGRADAPVADLSFRDHVVGELAVNARRNDDNDERDDVQDRRLDQIERHLDMDNPRWRHGD